eukprot:SAG22_NODE_7352_length_748_cov_2.235747_1_plen_108_part_00
MDVMEAEQMSNPLAQPPTDVESAGDTMTRAEFQREMAKLESERLSHAVHAGPMGHEKLWNRAATQTWCKPYHVSYFEDVARSAFSVSICVKASFCSLNCISNHSSYL